MMLLLALLYFAATATAQNNLSPSTQINPDTVSKTKPNGIIFNPNILMNINILPPNTVNSDLVSPAVNSTPADANLSIQVQEKIIEDKKLAGSGILVTAQQGIITLTGTVDQLAKIDEAIKVAKSVPGVKEVRTKIQVRINRIYYNSQ